MYKFGLYGLIAVVVLGLALVLAHCGAASTAEVIETTTAKIQPVLDSAFEICRTARTEIERHGGDASEIVRQCERLADYARALRDLQNAACAADPECI